MIQKESWYGEIPLVPKPSLSSLENQILREYVEGEVSEDLWRELAIQVSRAGVFPPKLLSHQELFPEMLAQILDEVRDILPEATKRDLLKRVWEDEGTWEVAEDWMFYESEKIAERGDLGFFEGISRKTWRSIDKRFHEKAVDKLNAYIFRCRLMSWGASPSNAEKMCDKFQEGELAYHHNYGDLHLFDSIEALDEAASHDYQYLREYYGRFIAEHQEFDRYNGPDLTDWIKEDRNWTVVDFWSDVGSKLKGLSTQPFWNFWIRLYDANTDEEIAQVMSIGLETVRQTGPRGDE